MKSISYGLILSFFILSCSDGDIKNEEKDCTDEHIGETRYTFSQYHDVDFIMSGGQYSILYDYSKPIDTVFAYSGAFFIGKDTVIYLRIRESTPEGIPSFDDDTYVGQASDLILYDGQNFNVLDLAHFYPHFSSFTVKDCDIYYWGFGKSNTLLCKYDLCKNNLTQKETDYVAGTDFFGHFDVPELDGNKIKFRTLSDDYWELDQTTMRLLKEKRTPIDTVMEIDSLFKNSF